MIFLLFIAANSAEGGTRILLLCLLVLAILLILAGGVIAVLTFRYAQRGKASEGTSSARNE